MKNHNTKFRIPTKLEYQTTLYYCGAACAAMVLDAIKANTPNQRKLYKENHKFPTMDNQRDRVKWYSSPDGLTNTLNCHRPAGFTGKFRLNKRTSQDGLNRKLIWSMYHDGVPCVALFNSGGHWVVVYGYQTKGKNPTGYRGFSLSDIQGFYVRDPLHTAPVQSFIDYNTWNDNDLEVVNQGFWNNEYVAICDPDPGKKKNIKSPAIYMPNPSVGPVNFPMFIKDLPNYGKPPNIQPPIVQPPIIQPPIIQPPNITPNKQLQVKSMKPPPATMTSNPVNHELIIDTGSAKVYGSWMLKKKKFYDPKLLALVMTNPVPAEPALVHDLDKDDFCYFVPMLDTNQQTYAVICLTAKLGVFREAIFAMDVKQPIVFAPLAKKQIMNLLTKKFGVPKIPVPIIIHPVLVWKSCTQSQTRFLPFYKVTMGKRAVFVRIDGVVFSRLTKRKR